MQILSYYPFSTQEREQLEADHTLTIVPYKEYRESLANNIEAIVGWGPEAATLLESDNQIKFVQSRTAGVDYFPLAEFDKQGILLANTSGVHANPIAEWALGIALAFARGLFPQNHEWDAEQRTREVWQVQGKTVLVFGTGHIGTRIAQLFKGVGARVLGINRHGDALPDFDEVGTEAETATFLRRADIIINVMPLTPSTEHYFNQAFFEQLNNQPLFLNVGRGASVDTNALVAALKSGRLRGAGLDVFEQEPLPQDSPLWQLPNVLLTPHIAGNSPEKDAAIFTIIEKNLHSFVQSGTVAVNQVDVAAGY